MAPVPREAFVGACRDLDGAALVAFVAALFEARGRAVERTGDRLEVAVDGERRVLVADPERPLSSIDADVVVLSDPAGPAETPETVRVLTPADLHRQLSYAVDPETSRDLARRHLGLSPSGPTDRDGGAATAAPSGARPSGAERATPGAEDADGSGGTPERWGDGLRRRSASAGVAVGVVGLVLLGVLVVAGGVVWSPGPQPGAAAPGSTETPLPSDPEVTTADGDLIDEEYLALQAAESRAGRGNGEPGGDASLPPGVSGVGGLDPDRLARAHRAALADRSYTLRFTCQEFVRGELTGSRAETLRVENGTRYEVSVSQVGRLRTDRCRLAGASETPRVEPGRAPSPGSSAALDGRGRTVEERLRVLLSADEARVVPARNGSGYRIETDGGGAAVRNASGTAYVTSRGLVRFGRWSYEVPGSPTVEVVVTVRVTDVGTTRVGPPQ